MKYIVCLVLVGCAGEVATTADANNPGGGGGLPTPNCGEPSCSECVGCAAYDFGCFGWEGVANLNAAGHCTATPGAGSVLAMFDGAAFTSEQAAAIVDGHALAISARDGDVVLAMFAPATIGDHDCSTELSFAAIAYFASATDHRSAGASCTITVTSLGDVGQRIEGSFSATVANGSFSVVRAPMIQ